MNFLKWWLRPKVDKKNNILLTGVPRSGTTLVCHMLNGLNDCVALHEPMEVRDLMSEPNAKNRLQLIHTFLHENRRLIARRGRALSIHRDGKVPQDPIAESKDSSGSRRIEISRGEIEIEGHFSKNGLLIIKHPALFSGLLPLLLTEFQVFATIRNPVSVLGSWMTMPFSVRDGHVPAAESVNSDLKHSLAARKNRLDRQLYLLSWFFEQYRCHLPPEAIIRYEDVVSSSGRALAIITPEAKNLNTPLKSRNKNKIYDSNAMRIAGDALLDSDGAYWDFYSKDDVRRVLEQPSS